MKKVKLYDPKSKKWLTEEEHQRKYKKRQTCKGGREHDWVKTLPHGVEAITPTYKGDAEVYYIIEKEIEEFKDKKYKELEEKHGIKSRYSRGFMSSFTLERRQFTCAVCLKQKYESERKANKI